MFNSFQTKYIYKKIDIYIFQPPNHIRKNKKKHNSHSTHKTHHPTPHQTTLVLYRQGKVVVEKEKPNPHIVFVFHFHNSCYFFCSLVDIMLSSPNNIAENPHLPPIHIAKGIVWENERKMSSKWTKCFGVYIVLQKEPLLPHFDYIYFMLFVCCVLLCFFFLFLLLLLLCEHKEHNVYFIFHIIPTTTTKRLQTILKSRKKGRNSDD